MLPVLSGGRVTVPLCTNVFLLFSFFLDNADQELQCQQSEDWREESESVQLYWEYSWTVRKSGFITFSKYFGAIPA